MRDFHEEMPQHVSGAGFMFWVFHVIRDYARTLEAGDSRMAERLPDYLALADALEAAQQPLPIVFGHNDLLPANFLDDGKRLWLIDFEYAGFNTAMFDLAGVASNAGMSAEESDALLAAYFGGRAGRGAARARTPPCNAPRCCARRCGAWCRNCICRRRASTTSPTRPRTWRGSTRRSTPTRTTYGKLAS